MNPTAKKVLLIEDDKILIMVMKDNLAKAGIATFEALDGKTGLDTALREKPDLILLDLDMPVMNGMQFLEALRTDEWGKDAVVVAFTNSSSKESMDATRALGVKEFIVKSNWDAKEALNRALIFIGEKLP